MTDAEFWGVLGEMIEGAGCLPELIYMDGRASDYCCTGLCDCVHSAEHSGLIRRAQSIRLIRQLKTKFAPPGSSDYSFYWSPGEIRPRIAACRALMRECLEMGL